MGPEINIERLKVSLHGWEALRARDVTPEELVDALRHPDVVEPHEERRRFVKNGVAFVIGKDWNDPEVPVLITVLWRKGNHWTSEEMKGR